MTNEIELQRLAGRLPCFGAFSAAVSVSPLGVTIVDGRMPSTEQGLSSLTSGRTSRSAGRTHAADCRPRTSQRGRVMTNDALTDFLDKLLSAFEADPPDSDYQRGYLEAIKLIAREVADLGPDRIASPPRRPPYLRIVKGGEQ
jgi:hypothetical protein